MTRRRKKERNRQEARDQLRRLKAKKIRKEKTLLSTLKRDMKKTKMKKDINHHHTKTKLTRKATNKGIRIQTEIIGIQK